MKYELETIPVWKAYEEQTECALKCQGDRDVLQNDRDAERRLSHV